MSSQSTTSSDLSDGGGLAQDLRELQDALQLNSVALTPAPTPPDQPNSDSDEDLFYNTPANTAVVFRTGEAEAASGRADAGEVVGRETKGSEKGNPAGPPSGTSGAHGGAEKDKEGPGPPRGAAKAHAKTAKTPRPATAKSAATKTAAPPEPAHSLKRGAGSRLQPASSPRSMFGVFSSAGQGPSQLLSQTNMVKEAARAEKHDKARDQDSEAAGPTDTAGPTGDDPSGSKAKTTTRRQLLMQPPPAKRTPRQPPSLVINSTRPGRPGRAATSAPPSNQPTRAEPAVPPDPAALRALLVKNIEVQTALNIELQNVISKRMENNSLQAALKDGIDEINAINRVRAERQTTNPSLDARKPSAKRKAIVLEDSMGMCPPENRDMRRKRATLGRIPLSFPMKMWTKGEVERLKEGVRQTTCMALFDRVWASDNKSEQRKRREVERIKLLSDDDVFAIEDGMDWEVVARSFVKNDRTAYECRQKWSTSVSPLRTHTPLTAEESRRLMAIAEIHMNRNWSTIASEFGVGYTAWQCFTHVQQQRNGNPSREKWTSEEDAQLKSLVELYGDRNWQQISDCMNGRNNQQCLHRWKFALNPEKRRAKWTAEEDLRLSLAVDAYGNRSWVEVCRHLPGRTDAQCRERWANVLDPQLNMSLWTPEEDALLMKAIAAVGVGKWSQVAEYMPSRNDNQCWRRYKIVEEVKRKRGSDTAAMMTDLYGRPQKTLRRAVDTALLLQVPRATTSDGPCSPIAGASMSMTPRQISASPKTSPGPSEVTEEPASSPPSGRASPASQETTQQTRRAKWVEAEYTRLSNAVGRWQNSAIDWGMVAAEVGGGRTAAKCEERWGRVLAGDIPEYIRSRLFPHVQRIRHVVPPAAQDQDILSLANLGPRPNPNKRRRHGSASPPAGDQGGKSNATAGGSGAAAPRPTP